MILFLRYVFRVQFANIGGDVLVLQRTIHLQEHRITRPRVSITSIIVKVAPMRDQFTSGRQEQLMIGAKHGFLQVMYPRFAHDSKQRANQQEYAKHLNAALQLRLTFEYRFSRII
jgi:hypothetical protein